MYIPRAEAVPLAGADIGISSVANKIKNARYFVFSKQRVSSVQSLCTRVVHYRAYIVRLVVTISPDEFLGVNAKVSLHAGLLFHDLPVHFDVLVPEQRVKIKISLERKMKHKK